MGVPLGPNASGLRAVTTIRLQPIPTGVYHLLDLQIDPPRTVAVENARAIKTIGLNLGDDRGCRT